MDKILGLLAPVLISGVILILNALLPGRWVTGYINQPDSKEKMKYHLNGIFVFIIMVLIWFLLGYVKILPFDWLYAYRWYGLAGASVSGFIFTLVVVLQHPPVRKSFLADLFFGRIKNLQILNRRVDIKMWLYLIGATMLELNVLGFTAHHLILYRDMASVGFLLSAVLITYFIVDYFIYEEVHLYTYDLFAERIGFKLGWGCLVFYPYFYSVPLWATADLSYSRTPIWLFIIYVLVFLSGWVLSRGANLQKFYFKKYPWKKFFWIKPEIITDGSRSLLINGFWGFSRHINYLGEILMATGIVLCTGYPMLIWPWLYPLYYVILLFSRQYDDDRRCALKYGNLWKTYVKRVPYRIIPFIY
jgi:delta14-sterol reductase